MLVSCREPTPTPGDCSNDRDADSSAEHSSSDLDMRQGSSQNSTAASCAPHGHLLSLRLVFPSEDGGVLIGKNGRHINKLKETTTATWLISSGHAFDDRIVTISGSVADIASAVRALAQHILSEKASVSPKSPKMPELTDHCAKARLLTLNMLFPAKCIGYILGPGGSRVGELRHKRGVSWLHVSTNAVPFTQERVVQASATAQGLETVAATLLHSTKKQLLQLQGLLTLYQPVRNGLQTFLDYERRNSISSSSSSSSSNSSSSSSGSNVAGQADLRSRKCLDDVFIKSLESTNRSRKRARSMVETESHSSLSRCRDSLADSKRPRRMSDNATSGRRARHSQSRSGSERSVQCSRNEHRRSSRSTGSSSQSKEEKLVVSDLIAGRLIGRNGIHLESLKTKSGAEIHLSPRVKDMHDRVVTVSGSSGNVRTACRLINESVRAFEDLEA
ncbi:PAB1 binding protein [Coemansia erecta]|nr:PAB1 binding protein [Coemansia erecta]